MAVHELLPDYIFEVSWEVCNKVGGIHTVLSTKALTMVRQWEDRVIMIGPDIWKGPGEHPEFIEDRNLFPSWLNHAESRGLKIKTGRWKVVGNPVVVLVDYTPYFTQKNEIFRDLWLRYKVDSLTGQWDYIEPALFAYAAGMVIECFYHHHLTYSDKIIAQFHEWMTGAGLLYLEQHVPQIGTVFTTHATVVGRAIAGNGIPLYGNFETFNAEQEARNFNVIAKHSLEKVSAKFADCFTTVSEITAKECAKFLDKIPDQITPNGFDDFIVPDVILFREKRTLARKKLLQVASALLDQNFGEDTMLLIKSGRYEFSNKGVDVFIDALAELNRSAVKKNIVAFIFIPAHSTGARKDLLSRMDNHDILLNGDNILTHYLQGEEDDPIMQSIHRNGLENDIPQKVKVIFSPVYLNGTDGIYNLNYYDLLIGFDLSVFPSYYEPWGYTPLESLAFYIPTVTTDLTGFGMIVHNPMVHIEQGIEVIHRTDSNVRETVKGIADTVLRYQLLKPEQVNAARYAAHEIAKTALWKNSINAYKSAYSVALEKAAGRAHLFTHEEKVQSLQACSTVREQISEPSWHKIFVQTQLPEVLQPLQKLAYNLWWSWNPSAIELFSMVNKDLWEQHKQNPVSMLEALSFDQISELERNAAFLDQMNQVNAAFENYMQRPFRDTPRVAYFCMEYGLLSSINLYSGGLGILAGDYLKQASDEAVNLVAVGLLFRYGYFHQEISTHGEQLVKDDAQKFTGLPLQPVYDDKGNWLKVSIAFPGRTLYARVRKLETGKVSLYLLDTDIEENRSEDRQITGHLYGGGQENRLKQELLLGIGGMRLLQLLGIEPEVFHYNEGHAAFAGIERLRMLIFEENISFDEALELVRSSSLFTTHTAVPAGHDVFSEELLRAYLAQHATLFNISWERLMELGRNKKDTSGKFSMSILALRLSQETNGVSRIHGEVSRKLFGHLWPGFTEEELYISHINNGVHYASWASPAWQKLIESSLNNDLNLQDESSIIDKLRKIPDQEFWDTHIQHKKILLEKLAGYVQSSKAKHGHRLEQVLPPANEDTLLIAFARRIVNYKRPSLIFHNPERLAEIIRNAACPVLILFAGKAHPDDHQAKEEIRHIIEMSASPQFKGNVLFLPDYNMEMARYLVQGADVWLNTPDLRMEASGTSGMKAAMNGVLNFSISDGWWAEAEKSNAGWTIESETEQRHSQIYDETDVESLYKTLEEEVIPLYLDRNEQGVPSGWVRMMKNAMAEINQHFNSRLMLNEYIGKYYGKLKSRNSFLKKNKFRALKQLVTWKEKVLQAWEDVTVVSTEVYDVVNKAFPLGQNLNPRIVINPGKLSTDDIGVEIILIEKRKHPDDPALILSRYELTASGSGTEVTYSCSINLNQAGVFEYGFRIYPKNELLPHRQDFPLVKWI